MISLRLFSPLDIFLLAVVGISLPLASIYGLIIPNVILEQGLSHRIFYFHVPVAWVALYGPIFASVFSILYLVRKNQVWDLLSHSANQLSLLFAIGVLFSGPIWAKSAWGVAWDWTDARLISFFILCLSLLAYFIVRSLVLDGEKKRLFSSLLSLLCAVNAILTWGAIRWIDNPGNHPGSVLGKGGMDPDMRISFFANVIAFHFLFWVLYRIAYQKEKLELKWSKIQTSLENSYE